MEGQAGKGAIAERIFPSVCLHFKNFYGHFNRQKVATENLFEVPKRSGAEKCPLADLVGEVGFTCDGHASSSNRVCSKGAAKKKKRRGTGKIPEMWSTFASSPQLKNRFTTTSTSSP